jgi:hypothetical protein
MRLRSAVTQENNHRRSVPELPRLSSCSRTLSYCFVKVSWSFVGGCRPSPSQDSKVTPRVPEIVLPLMVADPVPETEQLADPGTPPGDPV